MNERRALAAILVAVLYLQPATVYASVYSQDQYNAKMWPSGYSPPATAACSQSGVVDTAKNYTIVMQKNWIASGDCTGSFRTVGSGYLGAGVHGYRNGAYCGGSGIYWNDVSTGGWQLWIAMCTNPSGSQYFETWPENWWYDQTNWKMYRGPWSPKGWY